MEVCLCCCCCCCVCVRVRVCIRVCMCLSVLVVCDIRIFISILYRCDIGVNIKISIRFSIIFNCVGGAIFINMLEIQFAHKPLHKTNNKPRKLADKFLKWLDSTEPTFISNVIVQSHTKCCRFIEIFFDILIIITKYYLFNKYRNLLKQYRKSIR